MCLNNKGFTLLEVVIALLLMVILTGTLYGTYFSVVSARERGGARMDRRRELSSTLEMLRKEISSSFYFTGTPPAGAGKATATNLGQNLQFLVEDRDNYGRPASLVQFTALTPPQSGANPLSDVEAVRYSVVEKEGVFTLAREAKDLYLQGKSAPYPVIENIEGFEVECYNGSKWVKTWDTAFPPFKLPDCVRVTVTLKGGDKFAVVATPGIMRKSSGRLNLPGLGGLDLGGLGSMVKP